MAQKFQIVQIDSNGSAVVYHPETDADHVIVGATCKVPTIVNINDWIARSSELVSARKGETSLKAKIDLIDNALVPLQLLNTIKSVDGSGSGLDADMVDGKSVDDTSTSGSSLWTASKIISELNQKVNVLEVVTTAVPNKILKLNSSGFLPTSITGNSASASRLKDQLTVNLTGDVSGVISFNGSEQTISTNLQVANDSHTHSSLLTENGAVLVNNTSISNNSLWTSSKINSELGKINDLLGREIDSLDDKITEVSNSTIITQDEVIMLGGLRVIYGTVDIGNKDFIDIQFTKPFVGNILYDGLTVESSDASLNVVKAPGELNNSGIGYNFNMVAPVGSKLTWFVVGQ